MRSGNPFGDNGQRAIMLALIFKPVIAKDYRAKGEARYKLMTLDIDEFIRRFLPFEGDALAVEGDEPAVGNGDPMGVAGQIGEHRVGSCKRPLGIDHPFDLPLCGEMGFEGCRLGQRGLVGEELQAPSGKQRGRVTRLWR
jgi:hypothetical protein